MTAQLQAGMGFDSSVIVLSKIALGTAVLGGSQFSSQTHKDISNNVVELKILNLATRIIKALKPCIFILL